MRSAARWFWARPLRTRLMTIGVAGLVVILAATGFGLYYGLRVAIQRSVDDEARAEAEQVAALLANHTLPDPVPVSGVRIVQVLDPQRRIVAGSVSADRLTPLLREDEVGAAAQGAALTVPGSRAGVSGPLRAVTSTAGVGDARRTVIVAVPESDVDRALQLVRDAVLLVFPVVLLLAAGVAWRVIGRSLRPVEELRAGAARVSGGDADEELPVPPARDEIAALAVTLNDMLARLRSARERQRAFVADAAHELRSPVASLQIQLEIAERGADPRSAAELAGDALAEVRRLAATVEDLLLLARSDAGGVPLRITEVDLAGLVRDLATRVRTPAGVEVVTADGGPCRIRTDADKVERAVRNLLDNAVRHARSRVELQVGRDGGTVMVTVVDDGPGIPAADRERVFQRFTRLDSARPRDSGGSGLGLPIVAALLGQLGGSVTLSAAAGSGLRAEIRVPPADPGRRPDRPSG